MMRAGLLAFGWLSVAGTSVLADQKWPDQPIKFIVSQPAGAGPDIMARLVGNYVGEYLGRPVVVENRPGGGNAIGATTAARSAPDGYTFFFATSAALVINPFMMLSLSYDSLKDFAPVALIAKSNQILAGRPDLPASSLKDLVALDKSAPGKLVVAVDGPRNLPGVTAQALNKRAGTQFLLVPYPNMGVALQDMMAGRIDLGIFSTSVVEAAIRDGKVKPIAAIADKRLPWFPDLPTASETVSEIDFGGWYMLLAPANTPEPIVKKMNEAVNRALSEPKIVELAPKLGIVIEKGSPDAAAAFLGSELKLWQRITQELGIKPQ